jgi:hypothetical protein
MRSVRIVAVGLVLTGYLMAMFVLSATTELAAGVPLVGGLTFVTLCLGTGLFVSATVYAMLDDLATYILWHIGDWVCGIGKSLCQRRACSRCQ